MKSKFSFHLKGLFSVIYIIVCTRMIFTLSFVSSFFLLRWICSKDDKTIEVMSFNCFCKRFLAKTTSTVRHDLHGQICFWGENWFTFFSQNVTYIYNERFLNIQSTFLLSSKSLAAISFGEIQQYCACVRPIFQPIHDVVRKLASICYKVSNFWSVDNFQNFSVR